ncbi:uncharacterized protein LOC117323047 isoform X2 [Pecten maximus]|nr:uncharacterized protein LOC117323047 isoform X2 [Pecten maximus]XP_033733934.1 uncharacterized protein LOC117323047 isoform X2 [Pecten maximus]XP_033733935.1 uncharacterized protein LOC117323047 isoform X2 [Pecten maximus]XP_033733936.1 uncharacterized protein LOC117323047 isoform X2 [Pecten maximus]
MERLSGDNMRPPQQSLSPRLDHQAHSRKVALRRPDPGTEEFMRFIREYQYERQPTNIRLQKRAPLPGIGESTRVGMSSTFERTNVNSPYDDTLVDNEVSFLNNKPDPRQDPMLQEVLTLARERTKDHIILSSWNGHMQNGNLGSDSNRNVVPRQSNEFGSKPNKAPKTLNGIRPNMKKLSKQLPPISREDIPERPSAPSPSLTPPYPNSSDDSFVAEEPIDYIDL